MAQIAGEEVEEEKETSMIVDDKSITNIFKATESIKQFQAVSLKCSTVIACRLSPIQKSQIVRLVKGKFNWHIFLIWKSELETKDFNF